MMHTQLDTRVEDKLNAVAEAATSPTYLSRLTENEIRRHISIMLANLARLEQELVIRNGGQAEDE